MGDGHLVLVDNYTEEYIGPFKNLNALSMAIERKLHISLPVDPADCEEVIKLHGMKVVSLESASKRYLIDPSAWRDEG
jgi:hypothetical protein